MAKTKECAGVPKLGIARHQAPATAQAFTLKTASKDGLSRRCKACQHADAKARRARKGATEPQGGPGPAAAPDHEPGTCTPLCSACEALVAATADPTPAAKAAR